MDKKVDKKSVYSPCGGYETQPHAMTEPKTCAQERERERERHRQRERQRACVVSKWK